jgi:hypothetical protein
VNECNVAVSERNPQFGGGILTVVAVLGFLLIVVQGSVYYKSKGSTRFLSSEKNKVLASEMAEAGVEANIADLGKRKMKVQPGMHNVVTYDHKSLDAGTYSSKLTTVAIGASADTVDLISTGNVGTSAQSVSARLRLKKFLDTTRTPIMVVTPFDSAFSVTDTVRDTTAATVYMDPNAMPALNSTSAYTSCMASSAKKCDICHLPGGDISKANVLNVSKSAIGTHIGHHGDYVTTDNSCDLYKPKTVLTITYHTVWRTAHVMVDHSSYDTTLVIDTAVKVQVISWK